MSLRHNAILTEKLKCKKTFLLFLCCLCMVSCGESHSGNGDSSKEQTKEECTNEHYVQVGSYVFKVSRKELNGIEVNGKVISSICFTSKENPIKADDLIFQDTIYLDSYPDYGHRIQYQLLKKYGNRQTAYSNLLDKLKENNDLESFSISDLPKEGNFYKYIYKHKRYEATYYFFSSSEIIDAKNNPIPIYGCSSRYGFLDCNINFEWQDNILLSIRTIGNNPNSLPKPESIEIWTDLFPQYLKNLEAKFLVKERANE